MGSPSWVVWSVALAVGFPLLVMLLGNIVGALRRRQMPLEPVARVAMNVLLPVVVIYLFLRFVLEMDGQQTWARLALTVVLISGLYLVLSFTNVVVFGAAPAESWRAKMPRLLRDLIQVLLIAIGAAIALANVWHQDLAALFTALGVGSIVLGLALQNTLGNVMSGIALLMERPLSKGDWIQLGGVEGQVDEINWRALRVITRTGDFVIVPHAVAAGGVIVNNSIPTTHDCIVVDIGFAIEQPPNQIKEMLRAAIAQTDLLLDDPPPAVETTAYSESSITYSITLTSPSPADSDAIRDDFMTRVWYGAQRAKIAFPRASRTVFNYDAKDKPPDPLHIALREVGSTALLRDSFNAENLDQWGQGASLQHFGSNETVLQQGSYSECLYLIVSGKALMTCNSGRSHEHSLYDLKRGDFFGEITLFSGAASPYTVKAAGDLQTLALDSEVVTRLIENKPGLAIEVGKIMDARRKAVELVNAASAGDEEGGSVEPVAAVAPEADRAPLDEIQVAEPV